MLITDTKIKKKKKEVEFLTRGDSGHLVNVNRTSNGPKVWISEGIRHDQSFGMYSAATARPG